MKKIYYGCSEDEFRCIIKEALEEARLGQPTLTHDEEDFLNTHEACEMLRISRTTLHNYVKKGKIVCHKLVSRSYYSRNQIQSAIKGEKGGSDV
jgi:hypothetical protein